MEVCRRSSWLLLLFGVTLFTTSLQGVQGEVELEGPSESECRPYIEKALKELEIGDIDDTGTIDKGDDDKEDVPTVEITTDDDQAEDNDGQDNENNDDDNNTVDDKQTSSEEQQREKENSKEDDEVHDTNSSQEGDTEEEVADNEAKNAESAEDDDSKINSKETNEDTESAEDKKSVEDTETTKDDDSTEKDDVKSEESGEKSDSKSDEVEEKLVQVESTEKTDDEQKSNESKEDNDTKEDSKEGDSKEDTKDDDSKDDSKEDSKDDSKADSIEDSKEDSKEEITAKDNDSKEDDSKAADDSKNDDDDDDDSKIADDDDSKDDDKKSDDDDSKVDDSDENDDDSEPAPEEDLGGDIEIPVDLRPRVYVEQLLKLDDESHETENIINRVAEITLRELKKLYENAIKPLEVVYKYRDLSNRHFGDSEIFSKPLILFMGPWSGGKSSIINYLLNNEFNETSLRTGAEPSPAYFNILLHGDEPEIIDGTQLTTDFTFSGLQKFGQGLEERLRGYRLPSTLLEKVDIVEIPGILEVRKQVSRVFPFNDACQWFIDRADIIFLVYDPSKLDVGPETEAILDQLKGREHQTRIVLNKADQVKPEELMRVQGALIWNISPLMSSPQPPIMYTLSLWSRPYETGAPVRLLQAQERAFLRDLRLAIDRRIENKIASARRFAVRVRNHAKMVDCYLTTYYNHKSLFGNRKLVADEIIDHPQDYHIYEGLSTLTNISRYDLPDPDVYKDFFKLNPLYDFQQLSATCTYFRGCPINRLDIAIAYDLPELIGKHKRLVENALSEANLAPAPGS